MEKKFKISMLFYLLTVLTRLTLSADIQYYQESNSTIVTLQEFNITNSSIKKYPLDAINWYKNSKGTLLGLKSNFFLDINDSFAKDSIINEFNLTIIKKYNNNLLLVKSNDINLLTLIDKINNKTETLIAHPNFYKKAKKR